MATGWVKAFHCKSNAVEDVHHHHPPFPSTAKKPKPPPPPQPPYSPTTKKAPLLPLGCGNTTHSLRDVVFLFPKKLTPTPPPPPLPKQTKPAARPTQSPPESPAVHHHHRRRSSEPNNNKGGKPKRPPRRSDPFPTLLELPPGHSSRRVVEIIFCSSWSSGEPFPGAVEVLFKVHNSARTVARFEEYRDVVRSRAGPSDSRCAADGNEVMRFHSAHAGPEAASPGEAIFDAGVVWSAGSGGGGIKTFSGSGAAHESGGGGGRGRRRAMLVCRVIAGRIRTGPDDGPENFESVSVGRGELVVFDPRAVLPCFLIIYKI